MYPLPLSCYGYENLLLFYCYFIDFFFHSGVGFFLKPEYHSPVKFKFFLWEFDLKYQG